MSGRLSTASRTPHNSPANHHTRRRVARWPPPRPGARFDMIALYRNPLQVGMSKVDSSPGAGGGAPEDASPPTNRCAMLVLIGACESLGKSAAWSVAAVVDAEWTISLRNGSSMKHPLAVRSLCHVRLSRTHAARGPLSGRHRGPAVADFPGYPRADNAPGRATDRQMGTGQRVGRRSGTPGGAAHAPARGADLLALPFDEGRRRCPALHATKLLPAASAAILGLRSARRLRRR